jgi:hypothetical protein
MRGVSRVDWYTYLHERRDEAQKKRFESLYNSKKIEILGLDVMDGTKADSLCEGISRTNQIGFGPMSDESHTYCAVYGTISRINHSCVCLFLCMRHLADMHLPRCGPNTNWDVFDEKSFSLQLRACRSIATGDELTAEYCDILKPKAARQALLKELYHFVCGCSWCSLTGGKSIQSDINRKELKLWFEKRVTFKVWRGSLGVTRKALIDGNESQIATIKAEGLEGTLPFIYLDLHLAYVAYGDKAKAEKYSRLVLERLEKISPSILEQENVDPDDIKMITGEPTEHWLWGYGLNREKTTQADVAAGIRYLPKIMASPCPGLCPTSPRMDPCAGVSPV